MAETLEALLRRIGDVVQKASESGWVPKMGRDSTRAAAEAEVTLAKLKLRRKSKAESK